MSDHDEPAASPIFRTNSIQIFKDLDATPSTNIADLVAPLESKLRQLELEKQELANDARCKAIINDLTPNDLKILRALRALGAIRSDKRTTRPRATKKADTKYHSSRNNRKSFRHLKELNLIDARPNGGTWLTQLGVDLTTMIGQQ